MSERPIRTPMMRVVVAAMIVGCTRAPERSLPVSAMSHPSTPAGTRLREWLEAYNSPDSSALYRALPRMYSAGALQRRPLPERIAGLRVWRADYGRFDVARTDSARAHTIVVTVREGATRGWGQLFLDVDTVAPHTITGIGLIPFVEPPAWADVERVTTDSALADRVTSLAGSLNARGAFDGVVLVARDGRPIVERAYGMADRERGRSNAVTTAFELASVAKMFTAVAIAQLMDRGLVAPRATIGSLLPDYPRGPSADRVTVHHLLTMSSGIPDLFRSPRYWRRRAEFGALQDYWTVFATDSLEFSPGTQWSYSNSNYLILGAIVERVSGMPFGAYVERHIFAPAGMSGTHYVSGRRPDRARGYTRTRPGSGPGSPPDPLNWYPVGDVTDSSDQSAGGPAGGGVSSALDLARFGEALRQRRLLSDSMTTTVLAPHVAAAYGGADGYGFETRRWNGVTIVGHGGAFSGVSNQVDYYPGSGHAVVILSNTEGSGAQALANYARSLIARARMGGS